MVGWLNDVLVGWLAGWLTGWLVGWLAGWLVGWLAGWLVGFDNRARPMDRDRWIGRPSATDRIGHRPMDLTTERYRWIAADGIDQGDRQAGDRATQRRSTSGAQFF